MCYYYHARSGVKVVAVCSFEANFAKNEDNKSGDFITSMASGCSRSYDSHGDNKPTRRICSDGMVKVDNKVVPVKDLMDTSGLEPSAGSEIRRLRYPT